jgi:hypothetical protein
MDYLHVGIGLQLLVLNDTFNIVMVVSFIGEESLVPG